MNAIQLLVLAKAPVPGRVKTRLCPPWTYAQAATIAAAALADTIAAVDAAPVALRTLVMAGTMPTPYGWRAIVQRGSCHGERLANAFVDAAEPGLASLLIGMDSPQVTSGLLTTVATGLRRADAVLGPAEDGGWWALALRDPWVGQVLTDVLMSTSETGRQTVEAIRRLGLRVAFGPALRDVDTAADAMAVAAMCPRGRFAASVRQIPVVA